MTKARDQIRSIFQVLPVWLLLGMFFLWPLALVLWMSFRPADEYGDPVTGEAEQALVESGEFRRTDNYLLALDLKTEPGIDSGEKGMLKTYWRSLWTAGATTIVCLIMGYPVAYWIAMIPRRAWRNVFLILIAIPFWTSFVVRASAWKFLLGAQGPLDQLSQAAGGGGFDLLSRSPDLAVLIGLVYANLPFIILPIYASLEKLDRTLLEASQDLGAGPWTTFWRITVPLTRPGIVAGVVLVFIPSVGQFVISDLLGGGTSWLSGNLIHFQFRDTSGSKPLGAAVSFVLMSLVFMLLLMYAVLARRQPGQPEEV